jgi:hypothetical protein
MLCRSMSEGVVVALCVWLWCLCGLFVWLCCDWLLAALCFVLGGGGGWRLYASGCVSGCVAVVGRCVRLSHLLHSNRSYGISHLSFNSAMRKTGLLQNPNLVWICFHG